MLKFEEKFEVGQIIKAFDFEPSPDRSESFIIGEIIDADNDEQGFMAYKVRQIVHIMGGKHYPDEVDTEAWIPMEVSFMDFDERITKVG